jgi:hypothetical protein
VRVPIARRITPAALVLAAAPACSPAASAPAAGPEPGSIDAAAAELDALSGGLTAAHRDTFREILADTVAKDTRACLPSPRAVFAGAAEEGERTIAGEMPHYGFFFGPMHYRVRFTAGEGFRVRATLAVDPPKGAASLELPDCALVRSAGADEAALCHGTPYSASPRREACPGSGSFSLPATDANIRALLARWSIEAEAYWNRDAAAFGLPVRYDFTFLLAGDPGADDADLRLPLSPTCGRTPYFSAFRSGWSLPIVAHEIGHVLGLLDEYETFSGIAPFYPKAPFPGAEVSRMGLSMREDTRVLPLHHYLVLRRYFCPEPRQSFYDGSPL